MKKRILFLTFIFCIMSFTFSFAFDANDLVLPVSRETFERFDKSNERRFPTRIIVYRGFFSSGDLSDADSFKGQLCTFYVFVNKYSDIYNYANGSAYQFLKDVNETLIYRDSILPTFIKFVNVYPYDGSKSLLVRFKGECSPVAVYDYEDGNVTLVDGKDLGDDESFSVGDEKIRFETPSDDSIVLEKQQDIVISVSNLKLKTQFLSFGNNWEKRISDSGYHIVFYVNNEEILYKDKLFKFNKVPSANVIQLAFKHDFIDGKNFILKCELYKDSDLISKHLINVTCQSTFVDADGDGYDDITGAQLPNKFPATISSLTDFFKFIFALFSSILNAIKETTKLLKDFVQSSADFAKVLVSIFSVNSTISAIFVLSLSVAVLLRILNR